MTGEKLHERLHLGDNYLRAAEQRAYALYSPVKRVFRCGLLIQQDIILGRYERALFARKYGKGGICPVCRHGICRNVKYSAVYKSRSKILHAVGHAENRRRSPEADVLHERLKVTL